MIEFDIEFTPESEDEKEEARKQRLCNMTDKWPALASLMTGKTWREIYALRLDGNL